MKILALMASLAALGAETPAKVAAAVAAAREGAKVALAEPMGLVGGIMSSACASATPTRWPARRSGGSSRSSAGVYEGHPLRGARKEGARIVEVVAGVAASLAAGRDVAVQAVDYRELRARLLAQGQVLGLEEVAPAPAPTGR